MRVEIPIGDGNNDKPGVVIAALQDCCVVRLDDEPKCSGRHAAADWSFVRPLDLGPDPKPK